MVLNPGTSQLFHLLHKTTHRTVSLQTLPGSPLWHFQVFTVVTIIEGKQQTEPLPVSASHWETHLKHQKNRAFIGAKRLGLDNSMVPCICINYTESGHLAKQPLKDRRGSAKRDISTAGTRNGLKLTTK